MSICFAGLDWASQTHAACVIDERGSVSVQFEIKHDQIRLLTSRTEHHVGSIEDGRILMSFPRAGRV